MKPKPGRGRAKWRVVLSSPKYNAKEIELIGKQKLNNQWLFLARIYKKCIITVKVEMVAEPATPAYNRGDGRKGNNSGV